MSVQIVTLPVSKWRTYRDLRLRAIQESPQAFLDTEEQTRAFPEKKWKQRLADAAAGKSWQLFAKLDPSTRDPADQRFSLGMSPGRIKGNMGLPVGLHGKLVGMIGAFRSEEDLRNDSATTVGLWVAPEARRKGAGRKLMEALLDALKKKSIKTVHLSVNVEQTAAVALYEKLGFRIVEEKEAVMGDGKKHRELMMEKTLT